MVDTLRCDETFTTAGSPDTPVLRPRSEVSDLVPQFCRAVQDRAILRDHRVLTNMLQLEGFYMATLKHYHTGTNEIKLHMRKIVVDWMLEVTIDQRCHVDVFLLATNIMDRYLDTNPMPKKQFQLLGAAAIFLASKMVEPSPIPALTLVKYTADTYDRDELLAMELLILSQLKWDLTAITAYDYLDHLLLALEAPEMDLTFDGSQRAQLRRQTERLITLCATDPTFMTLKPSMVASASLASAVQHDFESLQPPAAPSGRLQSVFNRLRDYANIEMERLQHCIELIDELLLNDEAPQTSATTRSKSPEPRSSPSEGYFGSSPLNQSLSQSKDDKSSPPSSASTTPTEVFSVCAFCVT